MRVYELAKELGKDPAEVRIAAIEIGAPIKTNFNVLDAEWLQKVRDHLVKPGGARAEAKPEPKPEPKVEAKPEPPKPEPPKFGLVYRPPKPEGPIKIPPVVTREMHSA